MPDNDDVCVFVSMRLCAIMKMQHEQSLALKGRSLHMEKNVTSTESVQFPRTECSTESGRESAASSVGTRFCPSSAALDSARSFHWPYRKVLGKISCKFPADDLEEHETGHGCKAPLEQTVNISHNSNKFSSGGTSSKEQQRAAKSSKEQIWETSG
ncbi:uncharacterized protein V6R79_023370 [Siganus canaliculatus]